MRFQSLSLHCLLAVSVSAAIVTFSPSVFAAEQVILKYSILRESVLVSDLTTFAETGKASSTLQAHLKLARQDPATVRRSLARQVSINPILLDRILNGPFGNVLLDPLAEAIRTPKGGADRQALRAALTLSASGDGKLSMIEVIQKYPTQEVLLDGDRIVDAYKRLSNLASRIQNPLGKLFLKD